MRDKKVPVDHNVQQMYNSCTTYAPLTSATVAQEPVAQEPVAQKPVTRVSIPREGPKPAVWPQLDIPIQATVGNDPKPAVWPQLDIPIQATVGNDLKPAVWPQLDIPIQATVGNDLNFRVNDVPYNQPLSFFPDYYPDNYPGILNNPRGVPGNSPPVVMREEKIMPSWPSIDARLLASVVVSAADSVFQRTSYGCDYGGDRGGPGYQGTYCSTDGKVADFGGHEACIRQS